ncbi:MAG TPA: hypothetical protein VEL11_06615 [Candidatus Bathyarchaeia archaeon]|nr:hypothetical protein [Candidatus Bathyarchaeia archaeon]
MKNISVSQENYEILRGLGYTSDSMNDVITVILNKVLQTGDSWKELSVLHNGFKTYRPYL